MQRALHLIGVFLVATVAFGLPASAQWPPSAGNWPPAGAGNTLVKNVDGLAMDDWSQSQIDQFNDALGFLAGSDAAAYDEIIEGLAAGAVGFFEINNHPLAGIALGGIADGNTIGLDFDTCTTAGLAARLLHEWTHLRGLALVPGYAGGGTCNEAEAYAAMIDALCFISCEAAAEDRPVCGEWELATSSYQVNANCCTGEGGTPVAPACSDGSPQPLCGCNP